MLAVAYNKLKTLTAAADHARKGRLDQAIKAYREVIDHQPDEMRARLKIGDLLARKDNPDEAVHSYLVVAEHYADYGFARKAIAIFRRAIELQPRRLDIHMQLAESLQGLGLHRDVRVVVNEALQALDQASPSDPLATLTTMTRLDPENVSVRLRLGDELVEQGQIAEARDELERAAGLLRTAGQTAAFLVVSEKRLALQPESAPLRRELAGVYLRRDQPQRALTLLRESYDAEATEPATLTLLIKVFGALDRQAEALSAFKALAEAHDRAGQRALRDGALQNILKLDPTDADARLGLGLEAPSPAAEPEPAPVIAAETPARARSRESGRFGSVDLTEAIDDLVTTEQGAEQLGMLLEEAKTYVELGLVDEARKQLEGILAQAPNDDAATTMLTDLTHTTHQKSAPATPAAEPATDVRDTLDLAGLLEPNWLESDLVVDLD